MHYTQEAKVIDDYFFAQITNLIFIESEKMLCVIAFDITNSYKLGYYKNPFFFQNHLLLRSL